MQIKQEFNDLGQLITMHYHNSSLVNVKSKVQMKPYIVGGTTGRAKNKVPYHKRGLICPKCFISI